MAITGKPLSPVSNCSCSTRISRIAPASPLFSTASFKVSESAVGTRIIDCAGDLHWIAFVGDQLRDESGDIVGASGHFIDITDAVQGGVTAALSEFAKSRAVIEQAKGVLIAVYGVSADEAFDRLVGRSQEANVKVRDVASQFLAAISGKMPAKPQTDILRTPTAQAGVRVGRWAGAAPLS